MYWLCVTKTKTTHKDLYFSDDFFYENILQLLLQCGYYYHVESLNRSVQLHVSGFLPSDCYEQTIKASKGSCIGCRWHKTSFWAKYILTVESYEFSKIFLLSRRRKSLNRSKIACTQAAGEMHVCASLIWSADVGTNRAVHTDQFDLFSDFFGRFSDSTWYWLFPYLLLFVRGNILRNDL